MDSQYINFATFVAKAKKGRSEVEKGGEKDIEVGFDH